MIKKTELVRFGAKGKNFDDLCFLVKTEEDLKEFESIYNVSNHVFFAIKVMRIKKIERLRIGYEEFAVSYIVNQKMAIENLFQYSVSDNEMDKLKSKIQNEEITLMELFGKHKAFPEYSLLRLIL